MKILYLNLLNGVSGDMFAAALFSLLSAEERESFLSAVNGSGLPGVVVKPEEVNRCGITAWKMHVLIDGEEEGIGGHHHHDGKERSLQEIYSLIDSLTLEKDVKKKMKEVYSALSEAEAAVHGKSVSDIHFHEVGTLDAIADIMNACVLISMIAPGKVVASSVNIGNGTVTCAHGTFTVPAPATAKLLSEIPVKQRNEDGEVGELATPTGAALVKTFVTIFDSLPEMTLEASGYGAGDKELPFANVLQAMVGLSVVGDDTAQTIHEFVFTIDDMRGEDIAFAADALRDGGAVEVYFTPIFMKKGRPAYLVTVMCPEGAREEVLKLIFQHTSTIGLREHVSKRVVLARHYEKRDTKFGELTVKISEGYGVKKVKPEYEDLVRIAVENDIGIRQLREQLRKEEI